MVLSLPVFVIFAICLIMAFGITDDVGERETIM